MVKKLYYTAFTYLVLGLAVGVFYREFTKMNGFNGYTTLRFTHSHILVLGFLFFMILSILASISKFEYLKGFNAWYWTYNIGLIFVIVTFIWRGILQVKGLNFNGLNHIAGLGHTIVGISLIWFMIIFKRILQEKVAATENKCH
ncbi:DUF2871 domain-containing protein [Clostridium sp. JNZ J1-5]